MKELLKAYKRFPVVFCTSANSSPPFPLVLLCLTNVSISARSATSDLSPFILLYQLLLLHLHSPTPSCSPALQVSWEPPVPSGFLVLLQVLGPTYKCKEKHGVQCVLCITHNVIQLPPSLSLQRDQGCSSELPRRTASVGFSPHI